jgi:hypothetical protein
MKSRTLFASLAIGSCIGLIATSAQAQQTPSPCETYKCMAGLSGYGTAGPSRSCAPALQPFFKIVVFKEDASTKHEFDPNATAAERRKYLMTCPDAAADTKTVDNIIKKWLDVGPKQPPASRT